MEREIEEDEDDEGCDEMDDVICWMRTSAWSEMLNVEVWVIKNNVSICFESLFVMCWGTIALNEYALHTLHRLRRFWRMAARG